MTRWPADIGGYRRVELLESPAEGICETFLAMRPNGSVADTELTIFVEPRQDADFVQVFAEETAWAARVYRRAQHPSLEKVFDCTSVGHVAYLACEHLQGVALKELAFGPSSKRVDGGVAAALIAAAAEGLAAAHELRGEDGELLQFVHRNVSAEGIVLTKDGRVVVRSPWRERLLRIFGRHTSGPYGITGVGLIRDVENLFSLSPEVWAGEPYTDQADVYLLAVALFGLTTGAGYLGWKADDAPKFKNILEIIHLVHDEGARPPSSLVPGYPRELEDLLLDVIGPKSRRTPMRAAPFARALRYFAARHGGTPERVQAFVSEVFGPRQGSLWPMRIVAANARDSG